MTYTKVCVAGSFDGIHKGHETVLRKAFEVGQNVLIGLTSDVFVSSFKSSSISSYATRKQALVTWLNDHGYANRTTVIPIDDPFEPAVSAKDIQALIVSEETKDRGMELNTKRKANGLSLLDLVIVPMQKADDDKNISSTRVRTGEVDRAGKLLMPDSMRDELAAPLGIVLSSREMLLEALALHKRDTIITVGDLTTKTILEAGVTPHLMIIDNKVGRKAFPDLQPIFKKQGFYITHIASGPGFISAEARDTIKEYFIGTQVPLVIEIDGEEDLLALPVIAEGSLGAVVYYGQPGKGVVEVVVTPKKQEEARILLERFIV